MRLKHAFLICLLLLAAFGRAGAVGVVWLEAEQFADCGKWSNDTQFVAQMGSPYLLATGVGKPVQDAVTKATLPGDGSYKLWVRCKDWHPDGNPGQFQVVVNGKPSAVIFGKAQDDQWRWVDGGEFALQAPVVEVRLHDLTGWFSRCDAVVLSSDPAFKPSDDLKPLADRSPSSRRNRRQAGASALKRPWTKKHPPCPAVRRCAGGSCRSCSAARYG